jgi:anti-sigma B factor antagonist
MSARRGDNVGDVMVATFAGPAIDGATMQAANKELFALIAERGCRKLLLNFRNVHNLSSSTLGLLITLHNKLREMGVQLVLCYLEDRIYEVFQVTKLDRLFIIEDDPAAEQTGVQIHLTPCMPGTPSSCGEQPWAGDPEILPFPSPERD